MLNARVKKDFSVASESKPLTDFIFYNVNGVKQFYK